MEELQKLEKVQRMMSFMEARGLSTNRHDSDRFLADFLLFMVQPSQSLTMKKRCDLVSEHIKKISPTILEDAVLYVTEDSQQLYADIPPSSKVDYKLNLQLPELNRHKNMANIGLDCMQRANSTLEDFCRSYFMFHEMDVNDPRAIFKFLPVLSFTESYIYQLDTMNERSLLSLTSSPEDDTNVSNCMHDGASNLGSEQSFSDFPISESFDPLVDVLRCQGLLTERIQTELQRGYEYWELERKLCHALTFKRKIIIEDVMRAVHLKSFDYRVLNLLLYQLRNQKVNDLHMEFLSISEFLVEVSDDLYDYEGDVRENSFNILRMFVAIYGASTAPAMLAKCITEAEEKFEHLSRALDPELSLRYWRRCEEASREGGSSGHAFGMWSIPPVIIDEDSFRLQTTGMSPV
ncbi:uncharacterized protein LOC109832763 isoform X2 [Asparagus officinalis]|nr:uncharacterized protein LOC109832763 isoform X2 [Asparagus officinalis]